MKKETQVPLGPQLAVEVREIEEPRLQEVFNCEHPALDKEPCTQGLAPHIQKLVDSGFRIRRQKHKDSGDKSIEGRKRSRKRTRKHQKKKEHTMSNIGEGNVQATTNNNSGTDTNVQPMPGLMVGLAYGKRALDATGRFMYIAAAAAVGTLVVNKVSNWATNRAEAKASAAAAAATVE